METRSRSWPDPLVTANLYCAGESDRAIVRVLGPLQRQPGDSSRSLWFMRSRRRGEHLKIRLHCSEREAPRLEAQLLERSASFFAELDAEQRSSQRDPARKSGGAAIDEEDEIEGLAEDRSLLFTTYRRSPVALGGPPFTDRDRFLHLFTRALGAGCSWQLRDGSSSQASPPAGRSLLFFRMTLLGLSALGLEPSLRPEMLLYLRDWQVRAPLLQRGAPQHQADRWLERTRQGLEPQAALADAISALALAYPAGGLPQDLEAVEREWWSALRNLAEDVEAFRESPDFRVDPFAEDMLFAPVIKVFTGAAYQLGMGTLEVARCAQLMLQSLYPQHAGRPIPLRLSERTPAGPGTARAARS
ncbi:MAG: lantibiotic dehydratase C-terminal domain-containing protein [Acidobacteriota bacterium]